LEFSTQLITIIDQVKAKIGLQYPADED